MYDTHNKLICDVDGMQTFSSCMKWINILFLFLTIKDLKKIYLLLHISKFPLLLLL
jgi:hypothetical protein